VPGIGGSSIAIAVAGHGLADPAILVGRGDRELERPERQRVGQPERRVQAAKPGVSRSGDPAGTIHAPSTPTSPTTAARASGSSTALIGSWSRPRFIVACARATARVAGPPVAVGNGPGRYCAFVDLQDRIEPSADVVAVGAAADEEHQREAPHQNPTCARSVRRSSCRVAGNPERSRPRGSCCGRTRA